MSDQKNDPVMFLEDAPSSAIVGTSSLLCCYSSSFSLPVAAGVAFKAGPSFSARKGNKRRLSACRQTRACSVKDDG
jgi:hypothetical protein